MLAGKGTAKQPYVFGSSPDVLEKKEQQVAPLGFNFKAMSPTQVKTWALREYRHEYCDTKGKQIRPFDLDVFERKLQEERPAATTTIGDVRDELDIGISREICSQFAINRDGSFQDQADVVVTLHELRPDLAKKMMVSEVVEKLEKLKRHALQQAQSTTRIEIPSPSKVEPAPVQDSPPSKRTRSQTKAIIMSASSTSLFGVVGNGPLSKVADSGITGEALAPPQGEITKSQTIEAWVQQEYRLRYCDDAGNLRKPPRLVTLRMELIQIRPQDHLDISKAITELDLELANRRLSEQDATGLDSLAELEYDRHTSMTQNRGSIRESVVSALLLKRPGIHHSKIREVVERVEDKRQVQTRDQATALAKITDIANRAVEPGQRPAISRATTLSRGIPNLHTDQELNTWVYEQYVEYGFDASGPFKSFEELKTHLKSLTKEQPRLESRVIAAMSMLRFTRTHPLNFDVVRDQRVIKHEGKTALLGKTKKTTLPLQSATGYTGKQHSNGDALRDTQTSQAALIRQNLQPPHQAGPPTTIGRCTTQDITPISVTSHTDDLLGRKLNQVHSVKNIKLELFQNHGPNEKITAQKGSNDLRGLPNFIEQGDMELLLSDGSEILNADKDGQIASRTDLQVNHAPLISGKMLAGGPNNATPQYALLGSHEKEKLFLNTNAPFSAFICGVQGSGKSHSTSCILEGALIRSPLLGQLKSPLSALVFSYGQFGGDGTGYSISEAAFLATPHPEIPGHPHVKKVNVLVSPSNYFKISRLYLRIPNVTVSKFKLKSWNLDIDIMLTLMNVSESEDTPLYMAAVTQLLRQMASEGVSFNYMDFRARLKKSHFNPVQVNMLQLRLGLLESFLDLDNSCPEPHFHEGEVTIMDLSCPFVDANTACILFRIGLQRYLQSKASGKLIVLDEAHKYMLPNPGAKSLNETLLSTIRLQRHYGARVVISTQEPTLLTDLIALCSITIIHRFSSPEWFSAIKRHIPIRPEEHQMMMQSIENLKTGSALVYSPNAVLGKDETGGLIKGTGRLMKVNIRKRVTSDGGQSMLAV
ncbi:Nn.00g081080.m01.CDS01 [Neocucurbitaria sp. VM-36]